MGWGKRFVFLLKIGFLVDWIVLIKFLFRSFKHTLKQQILSCPFKIHFKT